MLDRRSFLQGLIGTYLMAFGKQRQGFNNQLVPLFEAGNTVVINANGLFEYNGPPTLGNLINSIAFVAGTDPFGNVYQSGITTYGQAPTSTHYLSLQNEEIFFNFGTFAANINFIGGPPLTFSGGSPYVFDGPITSDGSSVAGTPTFKALEANANNTDQSFMALVAGDAHPRALIGVNTPTAGSAGLGVGLGSASIDTWLVRNGANQWVTSLLTAFDPTAGVGTAETWHTPVTTGFSNSAGVQQLQYQLLADSLISFNGFMVATIAYVANTTIFTIPAAYRPANTAVIPITIFTAGAFSSAWITITSAGVVSIPIAIANGATVAINGSYRLTA